MGFSSTAEKKLFSSENLLYFFLKVVRRNVVEALGPRVSHPHLSGCKTFTGKSLSSWSGDTCIATSLLDPERKIKEVSGKESGEVLRVNALKM